MRKSIYIIAIPLLIGSAMSMEHIDPDFDSRHNAKYTKLLQSFMPSAHDIFVPIIEFVNEGIKLSDPVECKKFNQKLPILFIFGFDLIENMNTCYADENMNTCYADDWFHLSLDIKEGGKTILAAAADLFEKWEDADACERESNICIQTIKDAGFEWMEDDT